MSSPLFQQFQQRPNMLTMLSQLKQNPVAMLSAKYNVPQGMTDPNEILQHLLTTGQVTQDQVNQIIQMQQFMR